jgi:gliding motility-associated-like protein
MNRSFSYIIFLCSLFVFGKANAQINFAILHSTTCAGSTVIFNSNVFENAPFPDSIKWNFGDAASGLLNSANGIQQPTHVYSTPGTYIVTLHVVDPGAGTINLTDTITFVTPIAYNFGPDIFLCGDTSTHLLTAPIIPNATYLWNDDSATTKPTLLVRKTGTYTVKIDGCEVTDTIGVFLTNEPKLDLGRDHVLCSGEQLTLSAANENATYQWFLNGTLLPANQAQLPVVAPGGQYIANIDVGGCGNFRDTVNITFSSTLAPLFNLGPDTLLCPKEIFRLTANVSGASAYNWGSKGLDINDWVNYNIGSAATLTITNPGRYWAFVNIGQCEVVDTMIVRYRGDKQLNFNDTALCQGNTLILDADFGTGTYKWESIPAQRDDQNNTNQSTYYVYKPGFYTVTAAVGQCIFKDSLHVVFNDTLQLAMPKDTALCQGETFIIKPVVTNATDYTWQNGSKDLQFSATTSGQYRIIAVNGCGRDTANMNIVFDPCPCVLTLPNAFTPNGDGVNDNFRPLHACDMEKYTMTIFNRYGEIIFVTKDPLQGWDGTIKGKKLNMGGYVWVVTYTQSSKGQAINKTGSMLLLR